MTVRKHDIDLYYARYNIKFAETVQSMTYHLARPMLGLGTVYATLHGQ